MPKQRDKESGGRTRDEPSKVRLRDKKRHSIKYYYEYSWYDSFKRSFLLNHGSEEASQELQDEELLSSALDRAEKSLARTASMAQEAVEHRRELLREMAVRERQIDQKLARTARNLERLIAG